MTITFLILTILLHIAFLCGGLFGLFKSPDRKTRGTSFLEISAICCIAIDLLLIGFRSQDSVAIIDRLALLVMAGSAGLYTWAAMTIWARPLWKVGANQPCRHLVTDGPYRYIRNPFYTSYLLAYLSTGFASQSLWALVPFIWMASVYYRAVLDEEQLLSAGETGPEYRSYFAAVGRFWPKLSRLLATKKASQC